MTEEKNKRYETEWSFSFEKLGSQVDDFVQSLGTRGEDLVKNQTFSAGLENAESARVRIDLSVGEANVHTLSESDNLIEADITYVGEVEFEVSGNSEKVVNLRQVSNPANWLRGVLNQISSVRNLKWDVALSPNVPTQLELHGGVGEAKIDLRDLNVTGLNINMGTGRVAAVLPAAQQYAAKINGGVGEFDVTIPEETSVDLSVQAGTGEITLRYGAGATGTLRVSGGIGETNIVLPPNTAARIEAKTGIGGVSIRGHHLQKVRGGEEFIGVKGVWETPDYESADKRITIRFEGGIGALNVS